MQHSDAVYMDLLTYADLEALKSRHNKPAAPKSGSGKSNKRYLILTYATGLGREVSTVLMCTAR